MPFITPTLLLCLPLGVIILIQLLLCRIYKVKLDLRKRGKKRRNHLDILFEQYGIKFPRNFFKGRNISVIFSDPNHKDRSKKKRSSTEKQDYYNLPIPSNESSFTALLSSVISSTNTSASSTSSIDYANDPPISRFSVRRKSVFAEAYDPEDDDDDGQKVVFPKSDEQRQRLADSVKNILLFRSLDKEQMNEVLDAMFEKKVSIGDYIIKQGDDGDNFYVIQSGIYNTYVDDQGQPKLIHTYTNKGSFGELALLYNMPRAATIIAASEGSLWAMDRQTFRRIVLKSAFKKRKMYETLIDCVPMLKTLQSYERMNLADALVPKTFEDGEIIIKQGDAADGMYFVEAGTIKITILDEEKKEIEIKTISKGGYFGELALVTHKPRAASAYAVGPTKLAFLDVEAFERLLGPCMQIMKRNINDYESQLLKIFGSDHNITDVR